MTRRRISPTPPPSPHALEDLAASSRALLESAEGGAGRQQDQAAEGSVQDPLHDWPDVATESDEWVLDRPGKRTEEPEP